MMQQKDERFLDNPNGGRLHNTKKRGVCCLNFLFNVVVLK